MKKANKNIINIIFEFLEILFRVRILIEKFTQLFISYLFIYLTRILLEKIYKQIYRTTVESNGWLRPYICNTTE